jgi:acetyl-CoA C-acetyltransferase
MGALGGSLKDIAAPRLGSIAVEAALARAGVNGSSVGEVYLGCVLQAGLGQAPARQAALGAGIAEAVPCTTVHKVCGSGLQSVILAARAMKLGEMELAVAGGMENMSGAPYALAKARSGYRLGHGELTDLMIKDGLWDIYNDMHMGACVEETAKQEGVSREEQDDFAVASYTRAQKATSDGENAREIVPVEIPVRRGPPQVFEQDEGPHIFNEDKMRAMKPAFDRKAGTITAGNASSINDGAAALVLATARAVKDRGLTPLARIVSWGFGATAPKQFALAPPLAVRAALAAAGLKAADIDYYEINEAFAVVTLLAMRELNLDIEKVNPLGGAIAMGHPIGASGARVLTTLLNVLDLKGAPLGLATLCIGGGEGIALIVEKV